MTLRPSGLPKPEAGLVISYSYLWNSEHRAGRVEGRKDRPCAIVTAAVRQRDGSQIVTVVPITHTAPESPEAALEIPGAVKRHLGLDDERSWVVLDEFNRFIWPGYDLRPIAGGSYTYGFLPPRFFAMMIERMSAVGRRLRLTPRDSV